MDNHTKINIIKFFGDKRSQYQDSIKWSILGDLFFHWWWNSPDEKAATYTSINEMEYPKWCNYEIARFNLAPSNEAVLEWVNRHTPKGRLQQLVKMSHWPSAYIDEFDVRGYNNKTSQRRRHIHRYDRLYRTLEGHKRLKLHPYDHKNEV